MISTAHIVGAGIGGLTAAIRLAQIGVQVEIFEQSPTLGDVGAGLQLSPNAMHVFAALGIDQAIAKVSFEPEKGVIRDFKTGQPEFTTLFRDTFAQRYGHQYLHCHRADLHSILHATAQKIGVTIHLGTEVISYNQNSDHTSLKLSTGKTYEADMLVGADGIKSVIREKMIAPARPRFTGHVAWRGIVPTNKLAPDTIPPDATIWCGPDKHFVAYYLRSGDLINFVAVEERDSWHDEDWNISGNISDLHNSFAGWDPRVTKLLTACEDCFLWGLFDHPPLPQWTDGRVALLGDACHPMLPFMAQGAAMAIEDAYVLAEQIKNTARPLSENLRCYENIRKPRATKLQKISQANAKTFHLKNPAAIAARKAKFKIASLFPELAATRFDTIYGKDVTKTESD